MSRDRDILVLIGRELADLRLASNLTQANAATSLGYTRHSVAQWEQGFRAPSYADLCRLLALYNTTPSDFAARVMDKWVPPTLELEDRPGPNYESSTRRAK